MVICTAAVNIETDSYGIDYPYIYHVISQSKDFEEQSHHYISVRCWNTFYQTSC